MQRLHNIAPRTRNLARKFTIGFSKNAENVPGTHEKSESERMKRFHEQLKSEEVPRINPNMRFGDLVLVETDPETGELIPNSEKDPTKWGDWQHNGRVTDF